MENENNFYLHIIEDICTKKIRTIIENWKYKDCFKFQDEYDIKSICDVYTDNKRQTIDLDCGEKHTWIKIENKIKVNIY